MFLTRLTLAIGTAWQSQDKSSKKEIRACLSFVCTNRTVKSAAACRNSPIKLFSILIRSVLKLIQKSLQGGWDDN